MKSHSLLLCLIVCVVSASSIPTLCQDAERSALLHLKQGFSIHPSTSIDPSVYPKTLSWKSTGNVSTDCSKWDGVECDELSGHVIVVVFMVTNSTLFELVHLQTLNLADNNFSQLDVSYNQLTGPIPQGGQLSTFDKDSFIGNAGLCGNPLSKKCGNPEIQAASPNESSSKEDGDSTDVIGWVIRSMGYISGLVVGVVIGCTVSDENHDWFVETFGRRQHKKSKKMKQRGIR
ncbi:Receptor-like protein [Drosera capensis]